VTVGRIVTRACALEVVRRWRRRLGLESRWQINVTVHETVDEWPEVHAGDVAYIAVSPGYFQADLHIDKTAAEQCLEPLEDVVLHELVHIVTWPLWVVVRDTVGSISADAARDMNEAVTEQITRALRAAAKRPRSRGVGNEMP